MADFRLLEEEEEEEEDDDGFRDDDMAPKVTNSKVQEGLYIPTFYLCVAGRKDELRSRGFAHWHNLGQSAK